MSEIGDGIKYLYSMFIMRDLLSFVTPGAIVVVSLLLFHWELSLILRFFKFIPLVLYFPVFGIFYIVGFAVQCLGAEILHIIKFHNSVHDNYKTLVSLTNANERAWTQHERFVVLKQMCGNGAIAIFIAGVLLVIKLSIPNLSILVLVGAVVVVVLIILCRKWHLTQIKNSQSGDKCPSKWCKIGAIVIFSVGVLLAIVSWYLTLLSWSLVLVLLIISFCLYCGHLVHVRRQKEWEKEVLKQSVDCYWGLR